MHSSSFSMSQASEVPLLPASCLSLPCNTPPAGRGVTWWILGQYKNCSCEADVYLSFLGLLPASPCLSAGIPAGGECAEHVLTSQFIVTLAGGPTSGRRCSKPRWVEGAWKRERTVSTWLGMPRREGELNFPSAIVKRGGAVPGDDAKAQQIRQGPGLGSPGLVCWGMGRSGLHDPTINRGSRIQGFPQAAQLLKMANYYFCSFLSLGLFMHLQWAVKGISCVRQTLALKEAGWSWVSCPITCRLLCFSFSLTDRGQKWQGIKFM